MIALSVSIISKQTGIPQRLKLNTLLISMKQVPKRFIIFFFRINE